jgi:hypothetical protein
MANKNFSVQEAFKSLQEHGSVFASKRNPLYEFLVGLGLADRVIDNSSKDHKYFYSLSERWEKSFEY